jgi:hypothetical protein
MSAGRVFSMSALVVSAFLAAEGHAFGQDAALPPGVKAVWDISKAHRDATPTRERICINGLWLWQPATGAMDAVPAGDWGYFKTPGPWPVHQNYMQMNCQTVIPNPAWKDADLANVTAAWYQREIAIPADWAGRRITLSVDCLNSYAAVYLDAKQAGELRFPGGEVDLTGQCRPGATQTLSMLVIALPLKTVMLPNSGTFRSKQVQGGVERCGLCGDLWLAGVPMGPRISRIKVDTSVRRWEITFEAGLDGLAPAAQYVLKAQVSAEGLPNHEFTSQPFTAADLKGSGRFAFTSSWKPEKLWDTNTPENMYQVSLSLLGADSKTLDVAAPERIGFREIWINGRDFYLNGSRIFFFVLPLENALREAGTATYDAAKETMLRMKSFGVNFVYGHNYGCEPGSHLSYAEVLRAADDVGMLVALPMPNCLAYDWGAPDADQANGYAGHAEYYVRRVAENHPSVVAYAVNHGVGYHFGWNNPDMMDCLTDPWKQEETRSPASWLTSDARSALRAQAIVERFDVTRVICHHGSCDLGEMMSPNFYVNFAPIQEMDDWFESFGAKGVKPVFLCEYGEPLSWDFTMYRGWYSGRRAWGNADVPWELCVAQWNSQFTGDAAFRISEQEKRDLRWESAKFRAGATWHRWDYPVECEDLDATKPVLAMYVTDNWRALRTWGISAINCWEYADYWTVRSGIDMGRKVLKVSWDSLQKPGFSPDYIDHAHGIFMSMPTDFEQSDWTPTPAGTALLRNNMPLLAYIAGKPSTQPAGEPESFTSKDHNFVPGETVAKQVIIINNSRVPVTFDCAWSANLPGAPAGARKGTLETGQQERIPANFAVPAGLPPGHYKLTAAVKFGTGESQEDSFQIDVMPRRQTPSLSAKIALFDPKGETGKLLGAMKVPYQEVDAKADLGGYDILVIGKGALMVDGPAPDIMRVRDGLRVIVFEQTCDALTKRLGFRAEEYGLRRVFERVPDSPLLAGLETDNLRDWRGTATLAPPRITYPFTGAYEEDKVEWCGLKVSHIWRCGCRGNVASVLIEKPARGDFMPILDGGWSLEYSPLMVYREGKGMALFCQMDVTGRTENDPAAEMLVGNIFRYVSGWKATETDRKAIYVGDPAGQRHLRRSGIVPLAYEAGKLSPDEVLVVGTGGGKKLAADARAVGEFIKGGGRVLALGLDEEEAKSLLPAVQMKKEEHISTFFEPSAGDSLLAGIGPADVYNAAALQLPLVTGGAQVVGDGVLAKAQDANVVFWQLPPYSVTTAEGAVASFTVDAGDAADGKRSALVVMGTASPWGMQLQASMSAAPPSQARGAPAQEVPWAPEVGKTYTFAVLLKGVGGPVTAWLDVQRYGGAWDTVMRGPETVLPEGQWTDLHMTFKCEKPYPSGLLAYVACMQDGGCFRADMFRLYEGEYVPWSPQSAAAAPANVIVNPSFEEGTQGYRFYFYEQYNLRRTYRRASFVMTRALAGLGVAGSTPLLARFSSPVLPAKPEQRWLDGLYLDQVEAWDDPYRCFGW